MEQQGQGAQTRRRQRPGGEGSGPFAPLGPTGLLGEKQGCCGAGREAKIRGRGWGWGAGRRAMDALGSEGRGQSPA